MIKRKHPIHLPNIERHNEPVILFLTICAHMHQPVLANQAMENLLVHAWKGAQQWRVGRYIIMPDHIHLFCSPAVHDAENVSKWAGYWKGIVSRAVHGYGPLAMESAVSPVPGPGGTGRSRKLWQRDVWDTQLRNGNHYDEKWEYVRMNPVRKELVSEPDEWSFQGELNELQW